MDYNPYAAPAADVALSGPPPENRWTVIVQVTLHALMIALHAFMFLGALVKIAEGEELSDLLGELARADSGGETGRAVGGLLVYVVCALWGPLSAMWAIHNIVVLVRRTGYAYTAAKVYWFVNILVCLCAPFGLIGLVHLLVVNPGSPSRR